MKETTIAKATYAIKVGGGSEYVQMGEAYVE